MSTSKSLGQFKERRNLRRQRTQRGWSGQDVAIKLYTLGIQHGIPEAELGVDARTVSRWERGKTRPNQTYTALLSQLYQLPPEQLDLPPLVLPVASPPLSAMSGASIHERLRYVMDHPFSADQHVLDDLECQTFEHEKRMGTLPPAYHLVTLRCHLSTLQGLLGDTPARWSRDLLSLTSRAAILAAWLCSQVENWGDAKVYSQMAIGWAIDAGDSETHAQALIHRSSLYSQVPHGNPDADSQYAINLLSQAGEVASSPMRRAWLFAWRAVENAAIGDAGASDRDLDHAYRHLSQVTTTVDIGLPFLLDWDEVRLDAYRGNCAVSLGRTDEAITILEDVHSKSGPTLGSRRTAVLGDLAIAYAQRAEVEQACMMTSRYLGRALAMRMPARVRRARRVRTYLDPWKTHPEVQRLDEQFKQAHETLA